VACATSSEPLCGLRWRALRENGRQPAFAVRGVGEPICAYIAQDASCLAGGFSGPQVLGCGRRWQGSWASVTLDAPSTRGSRPIAHAQTPILFGRGLHVDGSRLREQHEASSREGLRRGAAALRRELRHPAGVPTATAAHLPDRFRGRGRDVSEPAGRGAGLAVVRVVSRCRSGRGVGHARV